MYWIIDGILIIAWIYLAWMVWKKKTAIFHGKMESESANKRYSMLKTLLLVSGISLAGLTITLAGAVLYHGIWGLPESDTDNPIAFFIGFSFLLIFFITLMGSWVIYLGGRRKTS